MRSLVPSTGLCAKMALGAERDTGDSTSPLSLPLAGCLVVTTPSTRREEGVSSLSPPQPFHVVDSNFLSLTLSLSVSLSYTLMNSFYNRHQIIVILHDYILSGW